MFPNLLEVAEHLTLKWLEKLAYNVDNLKNSRSTSRLLKEHLKTAQGAPVIPWGAVVGNHYLKLMQYLRRTLLVKRNINDDGKIQIEKLTRGRFLKG